MDANTLLIDAVDKGDLKKLDLAIQSGVTYYHLNTALQFAAEQGKLEIMDILMQNGADDYERAICYASLGGQIDTVLFLLNYVTNENDLFNNIMLNSIENNNIDIIQLMLDLGADDYEEALEYANTQLVIDLINAYKYNDNDAKKYFRAVAARYSLRKKHEKMAPKHISKYELEKRLPEDIVDYINSFVFFN